MPTSGGEEESGMEWLELGVAYTEVLLGAAGVGALIYGKQSEKPIWAVAGLALVVLALTVESIAVLWAIGLAVGLGAWVLGRPGGRLSAA
jgi:hypothetical protein